jgi:hypothetical protein
MQPHIRFREPLKLAEFVVDIEFGDLGIVCECVSFIEAL